MAEARYPKRLAFLYLDEIGDMLLAELVSEFGNNVSTTRTRKRTKTHVTAKDKPLQRFERIMVFDYD
jgi:hypothetical protein